jgi:hypothetical protein
MSDYGINQQPIIIAAYRPGWCLRFNRGHELGNHIYHRLVYLPCLAPCSPKLEPLIYPLVLFVG